MVIKLQNVVSQIKMFVENLTFNGLNLISEENIRQIEFFLQNASQCNAFRLATSLRYIHVELKRFMDQSPAFSIDRYVFFLTNCWLLSKAILSRESLDEQDGFFQDLLGNLSHTKLIKKLKLRLAGIEKIHLEGTLFGVILYFVSLIGTTKSKIFKWNIMQPPKGLINPEILLTIEIPDHKISMLELLHKDFIIMDLNYSEKESILQIIPKQTKINDPTQTDFPIEHLEKYSFNIKEIYQQIEEHENTPFDIPTRFLNYLLISNVQILDFFKEHDDFEDGKAPVYIFELSHEKDYPLYIRIQDKSINQALIDNLQNLKNKKKVISKIFGKLILERGQMSIFPLSAFSENMEVFISLSDEDPDYRKIVKSLYEK